METSEIGEWVAIIQDGLVGAAAVAAALIAYFGVDAWKRELKGKSEYELAKRVLISVYKVREAFKQVRNPAIYQYEYPEEMKDESGHLHKDKDYAGSLHVYEERWAVLENAFLELEEHHLEAQVEWGPQFQDVITMLRRCRTDLHLAIHQFLERKRTPEYSVASSVEESKKERSILYYGGAGSKHDEFSPQIDEAIREFETWLRPHVRSKL